MKPQTSWSNALSSQACLQSPVFQSADGGARTLKRGILSVWIALLALGLFSRALGQGTAFTYQGRLNANGAPADGSYDFRFKLYFDPLGNTQAGSSFLSNAVPVTNGLFIVTMDFGAGIFNGSNYWLEVDVKTNNAGSYTVLNPFQSLTPAPYAIFANTASNLSGAVVSANLSGAYGNVLTLNNPGNNFSGSFSGNGANLTNVNAATLGGLGAGAFWQTAGNSGTTAGPNFVGTADNQPLELHVNGLRALRLEPNTNGAPNVIGGFANNYVAAGIVGATIGGGGANNYSGVAYTNSVTVNFGTVAGGYANVANGYAAAIGGGYQNTNNGFVAVIAGGEGNNLVGNGGGDGAVIGGGYFNTNGGSTSTIGGGGGNSIQTQADHSTISGGGGNTIVGSASLPVYCTIGGGLNNVIQTNTSYSTVSGGQNNNIQAGASGSFIGGGHNNSAGASYATVSGGAGNNASSLFAMVGGGSGNTASHFYTTVAGGYQGTASGYAGTLSGGYQNMAGGFYATVSGGQNNTNTVYSSYSVIAGGINNGTGANEEAIGGGELNSIANYGDHSVISGGYSNTIGGQLNGTQYIADHSAIVGGGGNSAFGTYVFIGGGSNNLAKPGSSYGVIGGGLNNSSSNSYATVGGGYQNGASGIYSTVGGGNANTASGAYTIVGGGFFNSATATGATVPGGIGNNATGPSSFAAGADAQAQNDGAFVWGDDSTVSSIASTNNNSVTMRAAGGFQFYTSSSGRSGSGVYIPPGGASWISVSDRDAKKDFTPVDCQRVLDKLAGVKIQQWHYKWEPDNATPNIGPMAQDFKAAFYPGRDDKGISTLEFDGVELAAIQGLNDKLKQRDAEIEQLKLSVTELKALVSKLVQK